MCGRATLAASPDELREVFELELLPTLVPRYNIAPSQALAVVKDGKHRRVEMVKWGFVGSDGKAHVNARGESVAVWSVFKDAFAERRCVVLVDGFYEWKSSSAFHIRRRDRRPFALAGVFEPSETCAVITTKAEGEIAELHERMPVIIPYRFIGMYLDGTTDEARALLAPVTENLEVVPVSTLVNSPANDSPECLGPPQKPAQRSLF
jgi:putative SOS response-associated peptidase YedK